MTGVSDSLPGAGPPVALITGGAQGIGRALAAAFALSGTSVVIADRDLEKAEAVVAELERDGGSAWAVATDVGDEDSTQTMTAAALERYGRVDTLINNAAVFSTLEMQGFEDIKLAEWQKVLQVNLTGVFLCCRAVAPAMRRQGGGSIVNISSSTVLFGRPHYLHYVTSKAGLVGMTRALARELGGDGITVNALMPGSVATEVSRATVSEEQAQRIIAGQSLQRRLGPDDIVGTALFLASGAARMISGQTIVVDGGSHFV